MKLVKIAEAPFFNTRIKSSDVKVKEMLLGYLVAPFLALISNATFSAYLNRYYVDVLGWTKFGLFSSLLPIISVFFVIGGNVMVGKLIDQTGTKAGKARPYLLLSIPLLIITIIMMFMTPLDGNNFVQMICIAVSYNLYYAIAYPCYYTAHNSMVSLSTRNTGKRGILATLSNASTVGAVGLGSSILIPILLQSYMFVNGKNGIDVEASYAHWRILAVGLAILTAIGVLLEYYFTRERITEETTNICKEEKQISASTHLKACISNKYWWMVILFVFVFQLGQAFKNGTMSFYVRWMFDDVMNSANPEQTSGALMSTLGMIGGIPSIIGMVAAWPLANKIGKKNATVIGLVIALLGGMVAFINVNNFTFVSAGVFLKGIGIIPAQYVMLAIISDVLDHLEAKNGFRSDGFTMSIYSAIFVGLAGITNGVLNGLLAYSGYSNVGIAADPVFKKPIENLAKWAGQIAYRQMGGVENVLIFMYLIVDMLTFTISIILLWKLNVEKHLKEDQNIIRERQKKTSAGED